MGRLVAARYLGGVNGRPALCANTSQSFMRNPVVHGSLSSAGGLQLDVGSDCCRTRDSMSNLADVQNMLEVAEHAATAGNLASADELLRHAARIQEAELGPLHPNLASTLNNLAIVAEKTGRPGDAETLYRRAAAIASASLPSNDPMVAASRQNLEDFCRARGLPIDVPAVRASATPGTVLVQREFARANAAAEAKTPTDVWAADSGLTMQSTPAPAGTRFGVPQPAAPTASQPLSTTLPGASPSLAKVAIGAVVLAAAGLLVMQPWSARKHSARPPTAEPVSPYAAEPTLPRSATPAPIEQVQPPAVESRDKDRGVVSAKPPAPQHSSDAITLASVQLCRTLSTSGRNWRCDPPGDSVAPGRIILYTRVRSPRDAVVIHRWYRGQTLRQSVALTILASATEGYRTYSRYAVDRGEDWRVEVRSVAGDLLHEQRFAVR